MWHLAVHSSQFNQAPTVNLKEAACLSERTQVVGSLPRRGKECLTSEKLPSIVILESLRIWYEFATNPDREVGCPRASQAIRIQSDG